MTNVGIQKSQAGPETCYSNNLGFALSDPTWGWHLKKKAFGNEIFQGFLLPSQGLET